MKKVFKLLFLITVACLLNAQHVSAQPNLVPPSPKVLKLGLEAYQKAKVRGLVRRPVLTIIDYSKPSTQARLWVLDLRTNRVLLHDYVAHGKGSGEENPVRFSNRPQSLESSLGVYLTGSPYRGHHGYSLRLVGLEKGINDRAFSRDIVVHAASYASAQFLKLHGRLGRSFGCFAVRPQISMALINTIKKGTLMFVYYPDKHWLSSSRFLT